MNDIINVILHIFYDKNLITVVMRNFGECIQAFDYL